MARLESIDLSRLKLEVDMFGDVVDKARNYEFLGETAVGWFIFVGLLLLALAAWKAITDYID